MLLFKHYPTFVSLDNKLDLIYEYNAIHYKYTSTNYKYHKNPFRLTYLIKGF